MSVPNHLAPWKPGGLSAGRSVGEIGLKANGSDLDLWIRVAGRPQWIAVPADALRTFLDDAMTVTNLARVLRAESSIPAEEGPLVDEATPGPRIHPQVGDVVAVRGEVLTFIPRGAPEGAGQWIVRMPDAEVVYVWEGEDVLTPWPQEVTLPPR